MSSVRVLPGPVYGTVRAPPSKSYTHRALVVGHLSGRRFRVRDPLYAEDTIATAVAIGRLGSPVVRRQGTWEVRPRALRPPAGPVRIDCGESGTTLRFAAALGAKQARAVTLTGSGRLSERPIEDLLRALNAFGGSSRHLAGSGLPIVVEGPIHGGRAALNASRSSQFASSLLFVLPTLTEDSVLMLTGNVVSRPYIDATLAVLSRHRVHVRRRGRRFSVPGAQTYEGSTFQVPGDASSASYLWAAAAIAGGRVRVEGVSRAWPQADLAILPLLRRNGAKVVEDVRGATVETGVRRPFRVDLSDAPDLYPLAGVLAATTPGVSHLVGAEHVELKESNRKQGTADLARRLGATVRGGRDGLRVEGTSRVRAIQVTHLTDHRLVMSAAVGALAGAGASVIGDRTAVRKSYPGFWSALASIQGGGGQA